LYGRMIEYRNAENLMPSVIYPENCLNWPLTFVRELRLRLFGLLIADKDEFPDRMSYAAQKKKGLSVVEACRKKDKAWALQVLADPKLVQDAKLADPNGVDELGWTALHHAAAHGWEDLKGELLKRGVAVDSTGTFGGTPLQIAAQNSQLEMIKSLVKAGANVNAQDSGGRTALLESARWNKPNVAQLLLELGADPSIASKEGLLRFFVLVVVNSLINQLTLFILLKGVTPVALSQKMDGSVARVITNYKK
jgi:hypothetical protein